MDERQIKKKSTTYTSQSLVIFPVKGSTQLTQQQSTQQVSMHNSANLDSRALTNTAEITEIVSRQMLTIL